MSIEEIKNRLERFGLGKRIAYDPKDPLTLWPMLDETVKDARFLLAENQRLVEERDSFQRVGIKVQEVSVRLVEALQKIAEREAMGNSFISETGAIAQEALQTYKLLEKKD